MSRAHSGARPSGKGRANTASDTTSIAPETSGTTAYADAAPLYREAGWAPLPLLDAGKGKTPKGATGYADAVSDADVARWVDRFPDRGICVRLEGVVGLDVDAYGNKPGVLTLDALELVHGELPATVRVTSRADSDEYDGASGIRLYRLPAELAALERKRVWRDGPGDGIDLVRWAHRQANVWPTVHPTTGRRYGYLDERTGEVVHGPLPAPSTLPELPIEWGAALLMPGASADAPDAASAPRVPVPADWLTGGDACTVVRGVLKAALAGLDSRRHGTALREVLRLLRLGEQGHRGVAAAVDELHGEFVDRVTDDASRTEGDAEAEWTRAVEGAVGRITTDGLTPAADRGCCASRFDASDTFDVVLDDDERPVSGKVPLAVRLRYRVADDYDVFPAGDDGRIYAQRKAGGRAELMSGPFIIRAARGVGEGAGTLSSAATEAAKVLSALAEDAAPRELAMRVHQRPDRIVLDLAQPGNTRCVVITAVGWEVVSAPPPGVVFIGSGRALPEPVSGGSVDELRDVLGWDADDERWPLVKGWLPASLLANLPRPMLALIGPQGAAKTTTGRLLCGVIDPKPDGVLGSGFGKSRENDETKAMKSYLAAWDNVSGLSKDGADFLSRLVTGDLIERRKLYTDSDLVTIHYRRTGVITGITMPAGVKADTLDRFVIVPLTAPARRRSEQEIAAAWEAAHPRVLGGVLDLAVRMLGRSDGGARNVAGLRMADYAEALAAIDPELLHAYTDNVRTARSEMARDDPFIEALLTFLRVHHGEWRGAPEVAHREVGSYRTDDGWWPPRAADFSRTLTRQSELLAAVGVSVTRDKSNGTRTLALRLVEAVDDDAEATLAELL